MLHSPAPPLDLIFVSLENWDKVWRRNQFVCSHIARRNPGSRILFVGPARDVSNQIRRREKLELGHAAAAPVPGYANIFLTRPLKFLPNTIPAARRVNEAMFRRHVQQASRRLGFQNPVLWLNPHNAVHMAGRMGERRLIYDVTDDWTTFTQSEPLTRLIEDQDRRLCRTADSVIVCSQKLYDLKRPLARDLHLIPNGVDAEHYRCVLDDAGPLPEETLKWPHPVYGYTGTAHADRVDVALIERTANRLPHGCIVLVGPSHIPQADYHRLVATGRVFFTGPVAYERLPQLMRAFDVCIAPHRVTAFTESLNPIKLWEYLAAGKPIVATDIAGFRDYPALVRIATDEERFLELLLDAAEEPAEHQEARRAEARKNSWEARVGEILRVLQPEPAAHPSRA